MPRTRVFAPLLLLATLGAAAAPQSSAPATRAADHVVLISIDGFRPAVYLDSEAEGVRLPNLQTLRRAGRTGSSRPSRGCSPG